MKQRLFLLLVLVAFEVNSQYEFSGNVDNERWQNTVYLSLIEDYRKLSGIYPEQIIAKVQADSSGFFTFTGNQLEGDHRFYRIHVDNCNGDSQESNHFGGSCPDNQQILFIAKNSDTIHFPFSFENQMFCDIDSSNEKSLALLQIDSLKDEMRFAYSEIRSEANRKLNNKKWFKTIQEYGKNSNEPLAELYAFTFLSDRSSEFHDYYLEDLKSNPYYDDLKQRLTENYPNTDYTNQYLIDIKADQHSVAGSEQNIPWHYILLALLTVSIIANGVMYAKIKPARIKKSSNLKSVLTKQEQTILEHILDEKSNKDIADVLFVSVSTVKTHINSIYRKLNVSSRDEARSKFSKNEKSS